MEGFIMRSSILAGALEAAEKAQIAYKEKEFATMERITFGKGRAINVLVFTTRLFELASILRDYLSNSTDINIFHTNVINEAIEITETVNIDFFILVGRIENDAEYRIIVSIKDITTIIIYANSSYSVYSDMQMFGIEHTFSRSHNMRDFVDYMRLIYDSDKIATLEMRKNKRNERIAEAEKIKQAAILAQIKEKQKEDFILKCADVIVIILLIILALFVSEKFPLFFKL